MSAPSSVVRSVIRIASSSAKSFASFLIERFASDRPRALERDRVDGADPRQPRLERKLETAGESRRFRHILSLAPPKGQTPRRGPVPARAGYSYDSDSSTRRRDARRAGAIAASTPAENATQTKYTSSLPGIAYETP